MQDGWQSQPEQQGDDRDDKDKLQQSEATR